MIIIHCQLLSKSNGYKSHPNIDLYRMCDYKLPTFLHSETQIYTYSFILYLNTLYSANFYISLYSDYSPLSSLHNGIKALSFNYPFNSIIIINLYIFFIDCNDSQFQNANSNSIFVYMLLDSHWTNKL